MTAPRPEPGPPVLVASHQRSGTHLTIDLLRRQFPACRARASRGEPLGNLYLSLDRLNARAHNPITSAGARDLLARARRPILKTHALPDWRDIAPEHRALVGELLARATTLYAVRDGRQVMCSTHQLHKTITPSAKVSVSAYMRQTVDGLSRPAYWAAHAAAWLALPGVRVVRFEDLVGDTEKVLRDLASALGMEPLGVRPLLPPALRSLLHNWVNRLLGRDQATTIVIGTFRTQRPERWRDVFTPEDRAFFAREAGDMLVRLGYEPDHRWAGAGAGLDVGAGAGDPGPSSPARAPCPAGGRA